MMQSIRQVVQGLMFKSSPIFSDYSRRGIEQSESELFFTNNLILGRLGYLVSMFGNDLSSEEIYWARDPCATRALNLLPIINPNREDLRFIIQHVDLNL